MRESFIYALQNLLVLDALSVLWLLDGRFSWKSGHLWRKWLWLLVCIRMLLPVEFHLEDLNQSWKGWQVQLEVETDDASRIDREAEEEIFLNGESTYAQMPSAVTASVQSRQRVTKNKQRSQKRITYLKKRKQRSRKLFLVFCGSRKR